MGDLGQETWAQHALSASLLPHLDWMNSRAGFRWSLLELWAFFGDPPGSMRGPKGEVLSPHLPRSLSFIYLLSIEVPCKILLEEGVLMIKEINKEANTPCGFEGKGCVCLGRPQ